MQEMESIGQILKTDREQRGLSVDEVHDATKITAQNIAALEEDRFDSFPNKVYARAFLRDYANFLGLDSATLLTRYEEEWSLARETPTVSAPRRSVWKAVVLTLVTLVVLGGAAVGGYFAWKAIEKKSSAPRVVERSVQAEAGNDGATLPRVETVNPPKPPPAPKPDLKPKPVPPSAPVPQKLTLEVTALRTVWIGVKVDGVQAHWADLKKGETKTFEAKKSIWVRPGQANAVSVKLNGQPQPPIGTDSSPQNKIFTLPAAPAATPGVTGSAPNGKPAPGTGPAQPSSAPAKPGASSSSGGSRTR